MRFRTLAIPLTLALGLSACANPYDPGQRAFGGALIGGGSGAAFGAAVGGEPGAAIGALAGAGIGAFTGAATTPTPGYQGYAPPPVAYQPLAVVYQAPPTVIYRQVPGYYAPQQNYYQPGYVAENGSDGLR